MLTKRDIEILKQEAERVATIPRPNGGLAIMAIDVKQVLDLLDELQDREDEIKDLEQECWVLENEDRYCGNCLEEMDP